MMEYFRNLRHIWRMKRMDRWRDKREPSWDLLLDDVPVIIDEGQYFLYRRAKELLRIVDCMVRTYSKGFMGGMVPGYVEYSVWVDQFGSGRAATKMLYAIRLGGLDDYTEKVELP